MVAELLVKFVEYFFFGGGGGFFCFKLFWVLGMGCSKRNCMVQVSYLCDYGIAELIQFIGWEGVIFGDLQDVFVFWFRKGIVAVFCYFVGVIFF